MKKSSVHGISFILWILSKESGVILDNFWIWDINLFWFIESCHISCDLGSEFVVGTATSDWSCWVQTWWFVLCEIVIILSIESGVGSSLFWIWNIDLFWFSVTLHVSGDGSCECVVGTTSSDWVFFLFSLCIWISLGIETSVGSTNLWV